MFTKQLKSISLITIVVVSFFWFNYERKTLKAIRSDLYSLQSNIDSLISKQIKQQDADSSQINHINTLVKMSRQEIIKDIDRLLVSKERLWTAPPNWQSPKLERSDRIAHAGGGYKGISYTNSLEALESNKNDFNLFEIDLAFTSDGKLVCSHDWDHYPKQIFGFDIGRIPTYKEFEILTKQNTRFTNCTLDSLIEWLDKNQHASIVTDIKADNIRALAYLAQKFPSHTSRFIPQIYHMREYQPVLDLGFERIILTIYGWQSPEVEIIEAVKGKNLFAITVPDYRAPYIGKRLKDIGQRVYTHTINTKETKDLMRWFGVDEIYTDFYKD